MSHAGRGASSGMLLIGVLYVAIVPWLGYLLSIAHADRRTRRGIRAGPSIAAWSSSPASGALILWLLFVAFLRIPQPPGAWTSIF